MISHILNLRFIKFIVLEGHYSIAYHDTFDIDILFISIVLNDLHSNIGDIFACITLASDLYQ